jgi:hypothetical protein
LTAAAPLFIIELTLSLAALLKEISPSSEAFIMPLSKACPRATGQHSPRRPNIGKAPDVGEGFYGPPAKLRKPARLQFQCAFSSRRQLISLADHFGIALHGQLGEIQILHAADSREHQQKKEFFFLRTKLSKYMKTNHD